MRITKEEADKLPVETVPLSDGSGYLSGLDVFHQLHCLVSKKHTRSMVDANVRRMP